MYRTIPLLLCLFTFNGCSLDCTVGEGDPVLQVLDVPAFTDLAVDGAMDVQITKGEVQQVSVEAPANLIPLINTTVSGGEWDLSTSSCWSSGSGIVVHITTPLLSGIALAGSGNATADDVFGAGDIDLSTSGSGSITLHQVTAKAITADSDGSGGITITGTCADLSTDLSGSGEFNGQGLTANNADISVAGSGNASITVITDLKASVQGSGNIRYAGKPQVASSVNGSGAVIPVP